MIDGYTHNSTLTSGNSVPLGTQLILVCQVVGLPYGTPLSYTWITPEGPCAFSGYYSTKVYHDYILAINTTTTVYGGRYTCEVAAEGGQEARASFAVNAGKSCMSLYSECECGNLQITLPSLHLGGGRVVHSEGRLIPHEFPITDLQQISGADGIGTITCTVSNGTARFGRPAGVLDTEGVNQTRSGITARLVVNPTDSYHNRHVYCSDSTSNYFYLYFSDDSEYIPATASLTITYLQRHYSLAEHGNIIT